MRRPKSGDGEPHTPLTVRLKVMAYITHQSRLLVFREPAFPDAGIQVPGGSVERDEPLDVAVLREASEETGLSRLAIASYLGQSDFDMTPFGRFEIHRRYFYHLTVDGDVPETWQHGELFPSDSEHDLIVFDFFWATLPDRVPDLIAGMGALLPRLNERLSLG